MNPLFKKASASIFIVAAIILSVWQTQIYFSHAEDVTSTVEVRSSGGGEYSLTPDSVGLPSESVVINSIKAYPEKRAGDVGTNYDTLFFFEVLNTSSEEPVYTLPSMFMLNNSGIYSVPIELINVSPGTYDIRIKTPTHVAKSLKGISLNEGGNNIDFTIGSDTLKAGDINNLGFDPSTIGDNLINSIDLSILLHELGKIDFPNENRSNLNQDGKVDASDLNILLDNLDLHGD